MKKEPARIRFGLRTLFAILLVIAVFAAFPSLLFGAVWLVWVTGPILGFIAFVLVHRATRTRVYEPRGQPASTDWFNLVVGGVPVVFLWFVRHRWYGALYDEQWPRPLPYPDFFLHQIHNWWDRLHPAGPNTLKIHGEFYAVLFGVNVLMIVAWIVFGAIAGYVFRNRDTNPGLHNSNWFLR